MVLIRTTAFVALLVVGLALADEQSTDGNTSSNSSDAAVRCANSSDNAECLRRAEVCAAMYRRTHTHQRMVQSVRDCAQQLNITLPTPSPLPANNHSDPDRRYYNQLMLWFRSRPQVKEQIFNCAHQSMFNADGTPRREYLKTRVVVWVGEAETELIRLMRSNIDTCAAPSRGQYLTCVFEACYTP
ncbi:uncharacterized protein LOC122254899 [Penaeus japonicus]|uniref:uncharacterized protein LOC122254899 n=1 Tax=Penaeus japonicus TaxID=27405 RepID=UPI001C70C953|nr:uncharacterized protein LOC122254899 [Penaeus japonicus]